MLVNVPNNIAWVCRIYHSYLTFMVFNFINILWVNPSYDFRGVRSQDYHQIFVRLNQFINGFEETMYCYRMKSDLNLID